MYYVAVHEYQQGICTIHDEGGRVRVDEAEGGVSRGERGRIHQEGRFGEDEEDRAEN